jgi:predicted HTH transcriptional regulator
LGTDAPDLEAWILFFLECMKKQKDILAKKLEREKAIIKLPRLSEDILVIAKEHGRITISDIESITKGNRNTIKVRLRELVVDGFLEKHGKGKSTWYTLTNGRK